MNKTLKTPPVLEYLDISLDRMRCWKQFATLNQTTEGLVVDVMGFIAGIYPFRCQENSGDLIVTLGGQVFPTQETIEPDRQHLIQPARRYQYDIWNNKISETDTLGHTTEFRYNDANQLLEKKEPLVEVVDEQGQTQMCSPITTSAYNLCNQLIAKRDANNHTHGFILDAAGHCIIEVLAKGTQRKIQLFDALNTVYETRDGANQRTTYHYDNESNLLVLKQPSGKQQRYTYNEQKQRTSSTDTAHHTHYYNFDPFGNLIERYEPLGQCTRMIYGPYHQMIRVENPDESFLTWQQDASGKTTQHTDLSGASYQYTYDYKGQVIEVTSKGGDHGSQLNLNVFRTYYEDFYHKQINDVPGQHLRYHYISGQVTEIDDEATGKKTTYRYDSEGRCFAIQVITQQNEIIRETSTQVDALGREILTRDKQAIFTTGYDAVSNRRFIKAEVKLGYATDPLKQEVWWKYDTEDKVILSEGILKEGQIILVPNQGAEFSYQHDRRITEKKLDTHGDVITATLQYDVDGHLIGTLYSTGEKTERFWTEDRQQQTYKQSEDETIYRQQDDYYNENGWLLSTTQRQVKQEDPVRIEYKDISPMGLPNKQLIHYNDDDRNQDYLDYQYVGWDQWRVNKLGGRRHNRHGWSDYSAAQNFFGPNGEQNGILGAQEDKYFEKTPDGLVLYRINLTAGSNRAKGRTNYVYRINGQYLGSYEHSEQDTRVDLNWVRHRHRNNAGREIGLLKGNHPGQAVSFDPLTENNRHFGDHDAFSSIPKTYICVAGDQYESIAEKIYGDASLASYIEAANGGGTLIAGQTLVIPQLIVVHNKSGMAQPYYQFMQRIQGSFIPYLNTPQPKQSFWEQLLCAVATVVAIVVAPHLAFIASTAAALGVSEAVITGVFVGLVEASAQGLCIGLGLKDHFSFAEALSAGISAGFATHLGFIAPTGDLSPEETLRYVLQVGMMNVEEQLVEMAIGIRHQFDLAGVALAMGSAGLSRKIKVDNPWKKRVLTDLSSTAMSSIVRGRFDVESLAIQLIADTTGLVVQEALNKASTSNSSSYQQSQRAGRTAKNWSYTTIDQEWDALLINDAKHVSQLTLPSITLDPDDPHIAYQLGEQVSHFQHPSQNTLPKNQPHSWRQSINKALEHRALMAKGRFFFFSYPTDNPTNIDQTLTEQQLYTEIGKINSIVEYKVTKKIVRLLWAVRKGITIMNLMTSMTKFTIKKITPSPSDQQKEKIKTIELLIKD